MDSATSSNNAQSTSFPSIYIISLLCISSESELSQLWHRNLEYFLRHIRKLPPERYEILDNDTSGSLDQKSPLEIAYYRSGIHEKGDMTSYDREIERLHVVFLSSTGWGVTPVCTRVNTTRVKKNNDAVFSAAPESSRRNLYLSAALALVVTAFML
ncbi:hypothetical protein D6D22_09705 [Aureobasidium pullulans]|uniref:Uncharacterized protein n=1 Tax=Aureobasidium pullulans TaxID=5580 RepID=A0A4S8X4E1_AURPU|nr:hypothetical protein D6D22_09705 [Aureobasidium pullulans]